MEVHETLLAENNYYVIENNFNLLLAIYLR